jgi:DNA-binding response OmpR family regulator
VRLLLVEDHERLAAFVAQGLRAEGFAIDRVGRVDDAESASRTVRYDAIILDLGLPDADGMDLVQHLRDRGEPTPILILTARDAVGDRVKGLNQGADDYLMKPFALEELVARVRALLRRPGQALGLRLTSGNIELDTTSPEVYVGGQPLPLSRREFGALELLLRRSNRVVSKQLMEEALYGFEEEVSANAIEVLIHRLRRRLQAAGATPQIHTLRGIGYLLSEQIP